MRSFPAFIFIAAVAGHNIDRRQGSSVGSASSTITSAASAASATSFSFSLLSTNPTAFPLASIVSNAPSQATSPLATTPAAGAVPTGLNGAPGLPNVATIAPSSYPSLDVGPPLDSPEVLQWIQDVKNSGINIPDINQTVAGGCPANAAAAANATETGRCWWTCGGCVRDTDISDCPDPLTWGLTYDDGPSFYTSQLLDYLDEQKLKSTFFVVGSRVISFPATLQAEYLAGHQIAVHTWSHPALTTLSNEAIIAELGWSKKVIHDVLGVTPNFMRPPFGDIDDRVRAISIAMGLTPVIWSRISATATFDTDDFDIHGGLTTAPHVLSNWENILANALTRNSGFIVLEHDLFQQTVELATGYILPDAIAHNKFKIEPVITCLNKPMADAYIELNDNTTNPPAASGAGGLTGGSSPSGTASGSGSSASFSVSFGAVLGTIISGLIIAVSAMLF
ncbi:hypothetical protein C8J56DRAFT_917949 [Mycena floridula]|nr:hypothetical protein C8J56DRAFT_917949 [Mycena floridula]